MGVGDAHDRLARKGFSGRRVQTRTLCDAPCAPHALSPPRRRIAPGLSRCWDKTRNHLGFGLRFMLIPPQGQRNDSEVSTGGRHIEPKLTLSASWSHVSFLAYLGRGVMYDLSSRCVSKRTLAGGWPFLPKPRSDSAAIILRAPYTSAPFPGTPPLAIVHSAPELICGMTVHGTHRPDYLDRALFARARCH